MEEIHEQEEVVSAEEVEQEEQHVVVEEPQEFEAEEPAEAPEAEVTFEEMPEEPEAVSVGEPKPVAAKEPKRKISPPKVVDKPKFRDELKSVRTEKKVEEQKEQKEEVKLKRVKPVEKPEEPKVEREKLHPPKKVEKPEAAPVHKPQEEEAKPKEKPKVKKAQQAIPKVKPELPKSEILEAQDYEEPMRELANIGARLEQGVSVTELNAAYQANEFPALKRKTSQIAILKAVERVGESAVVQQVLAQEFPETTPADQTLAGSLEHAGFQALLTTLANESHKIEEIITQVQPEDFTDQIVEERFAKIVQDSQELLAAPQVV